ncbi:MULTISPECIES: MurR/RpiR family transcriptional regulator [Faecalicoccus]|uniref:MurR/RpiR family transcriptional regulator n=1 Tax=Faecalicoccus TaxID=1573536 RepID=UPI00189BD452|nr:MULTISPECIES: MurR/RpiR family transcriptional regulator [Faecalicoccus]MDB7984199.1 MurR/RpiR family transcriptional regulator [Faecalicoccus pleomorphus]MDY4277888.1 MurR/RpiR family transcriptional regulator [Faecalicoccus sp.]
MFIQVDKEIYEKLSEVERSVIHFLNQNEEKIPYMSITNIADKTFTSQSTVSRAIQKCGFQGISQLRYEILQQDQFKSRHESGYEMNNILSKSYRECTKTIDSISPISMLDTIQLIKEAKNIFIYARGFTALIAEEFQMYLQLLGYNAIIVKDVKWMENTKYIVKENDLVFIISVRNSTPELSSSARIAKQIGAKVITCCCKNPNGLEQYSDIVIPGHSEQIMKASGLTVYSRIPLLIITRTIIEYLGND